MADDHSGSARGFLAFIFGGLLMILATVGVIMTSGRTQTQLAASKPAAPHTETRTPVALVRPPI